MKKLEAERSRKGRIWRKEGVGENGGIKCEEMKVKESVSWRGRERGVRRREKERMREKMGGNRNDDGCNRGK